MKILIEQGIFIDIIVIVDVVIILMIPTLLGLVFRLRNKTETHQIKIHIGYVRELYQRRQ